MYLHLGKDTVVRKRDVLAVFDLDNSSHALITREYLTRAEKAGRVRNVAVEELPKAFVVCTEPGGKQTVYLSQLSSATLLKRMGTEGFEY